MHKSPLSHLVFQFLFTMLTVSIQVHTPQLPLRLLGLPHLFWHSLPSHLRLIPSLSTSQLLQSPVPFELNRLAWLRRWCVRVVHLPPPLPTPFLLNSMDFALPQILRNEPHVHCNFQSGWITAFQPYGGMILPSRPTGSYCPLATWGPSTSTSWERSQD